MKRKRKWLKRLIIAVSAVFALLLIAGAGSLWHFRDRLIWRSDPRPDVPSIAVDTENLSGFAVDALYLVQMVERVHPIFIMEGYLPENYAAVRDAFIDGARGFTTQSEFVLAAYRYVTTLKDGHIAGFLLFDPDYRARTYPGMFWIDWVVYEGGLFLNDENGRTDTEVISIGGIPPCAFMGSDR